jgi:hypothetical protein
MSRLLGSVIGKEQHMLKSGLLAVLLMLGVTQNGLAQDAWKRETTRYLSLEMPSNWISNPGIEEGVRYDAPEGGRNAPAAVFVGVHDKGKWKNLAHFMSEQKKKDRRKFTNRKIRGAIWAQTRDVSDGFIETTLYTVHNGEMIQITADLDFDKKDLFESMVNRILNSVVLLP